MTTNDLDERVAPKIVENIIDIPSNGSAGQSNLVGDQRPILILVNPNSGRGKSLKILRKCVKKYFDSRKITYEVFVTTATFRTKDYLAKKSTAELLRFRALVVVSGDGLVFELVNAIMARPDWQQIMTLPIGIIPTGSGNGLAYTLIGQSQARVKNPEEAVELCCQQAAQRETCQSDLVRITYASGRSTVWSFLSIGWGLMADIDVDSDWLRRLGEARFTIYGLLRALTSVSYKGRLSYKPAHNPAHEIHNSEPNSTNDASHTNSAACAKNLLLTSDRMQPVGGGGGEPQAADGAGDLQEDEWVHIEDKFACLYAVHQSHISRTTRFAPKSTPADGLIYLTYVRGKLSPCRVIQFLLSIEDASHANLSYVDVVAVREFKFLPLEPGKIVVDGERIDWTLADGPLTAQIVPEAMKLIWASGF